MTNPSSLFSMVQRGMSAQMVRMNAAASNIANSGSVASSEAAAYRPIRAVFQQGFRDLDHAAMPSLLRPHKGRYGLCDYEKVFCADLKSGDDIFAMRGIDRVRGAVVVVRPDQYVAEVLPLGDNEGISAFFSAFLLPR